MTVVLKHILIAVICFSLAMQFNCCKCQAAVKPAAHAGSVGVRFFTVAGISVNSSRDNCHCRQLTTRTLSLRKLEIAVPTSRCPMFVQLTTLLACGLPNACQPGACNGAAQTDFSPRYSLLSLHCALRI